MNLKAVLEGLLFVSGDEGISVEQIKNVLEINEEDILKLIEELILDCKDRGITISKFGDKIKFITKKEHAEYYKKLFNNEDNGNLSPSALETLAIIAYNEPVTRIMVDEIRGVSSAHIVRKLAFRNLIEEKGRSNLPGRPILYGVTNDFLDYFGLTSIKDLPPIKVDEEEVKEENLFSSKYTEI